MEEHRHGPVVGLGTMRREEDLERDVLPLAAETWAQALVKWAA